MDRVMSGFRMSRCLLAAAAGILFAAAAPVAAQGFPEKPIRIIVPYPPGGAGDLTARLIGEQLTAQWKQPVVVEFKPGSSNIIGLQALAAAPKDGYTLMLCATNIATNDLLYRNLPYKASDIVGVSLALRNPYVAVASNSLPGSTAKDFVEYVRQHPGKANFATLGPGSPANFLAQAFAHDNGLQMVGIPYKGTAQVMPDLMTGTVDFYLDSAALSLPMHRQGKVKIIGVASDQRLPSAPDIPTMREQGFPFSYDSWFGVCAPSGVPAPVLSKLGEGVRKAVASEDFQTRIRQTGAIPASSPSPEDFTRFMREEVETWGRIVRPLHLQLD
jgi:tripartite-type tricarboxylate transporter receptor subunit TctC